MYKHKSIRDGAFRHDLSRLFLKLEITSGYFMLPPCCTTISRGVFTRYTAILPHTMHWYLIHTKPRQEHRALTNLAYQGYHCYLPLLPTQKIRQRLLQTVDAPLFPRYLFVRLDTGEQGQNWAPIRSTKGVSRIVTFGFKPAHAESALIEALQAQEAALSPQTLFHPGDALQVTQGPFAGIEALYQMADGEARALVLIEIMSKSIPLKIAFSSLRKSD
jgi:transcriptional antiterminator RfaH